MSPQTHAAILFVGDGEDRSAVAALRDSEARLRDILNNAPVVAHVKDLTGHYRLVNHRWERVFHLSAAQVVGRSVFDVHPRDRAEALLANDRVVMDSDVPLEF